jgi:hypothetical protein
MAKSQLMSAHQPVYLPWLGLFHKIAVADLFVIFDIVPYSRKMFYNRNRILGPNGEVMLSIPVRFSRDDVKLHSEVQIANDLNWSHKHWSSIVSAYKKLPFFDAYAGPLEAIYKKPWERLVDLNEALLLQLMASLGIETPLVRASTYDFHGHKSDLVLDMCRKLGAGAYLFGALGRDYADVGAFLASGIAPLFQDYHHPRYAQNSSAEFVSHLSVLDLLFRAGPDSLDILMSGNRTRDEYLSDAAFMKSS